MSDKLETERETAFHSKWLHQATVHRLYKPDGQGGRVCVGVVEPAAWSPASCGEGVTDVADGVPSVVIRLTAISNWKFVAFDSFVTVSESSSTTAADGAVR